MCDTGTWDAFATMPITIKSNLKTPESETELKRKKNVIKSDTKTFDTIPGDPNTQIVSASEKKNEQK